MLNKIILASKSEVRKEILDKNNIKSSVVPSNVDEDIIKTSLLNEKASPEIISKNLAELKANKVSLKKTENIQYTDLENIKKEVQEAKKTFQKYKWPLIDVTRKSVEETAASIIKIHEIYLNNVK